MMKVILLIFPIMLFVCGQAFAKSSKTSSPKSQRTTKANFAGTTVSGKYAHSPEANVQIESEKSLIGLVKPRTSFNQQIQISVEELHGKN